VRSEVNVALHVAETCFIRKIPDNPQWILAGDGLMTLQTWKDVEGQANFVCVRHLNLGAECVETAPEKDEYSQYSSPASSVVSLPSLGAPRV
jgi:hypothetical protein